LENICINFFTGNFQTHNPSFTAHKIHTCTKFHIWPILFHRFVSVKLHNLTSQQWYIANFARSRAGGLP